MCAVLLGGWNSTYYHLRACLILTTSGPVGDLGGVTPMLLWWRPGGTLMNWLYISSDTGVGYPYSVCIGRPQRVKIIDHALCHASQLFTCQRKVDSCCQLPWHGMAIPCLEQHHPYYMVVEIQKNSWLLLGKEHQWTTDSWFNVLWSCRNNC